MIWVYFPNSEQKTRFKNHFRVLKKSKSFECIFTIVKFLKSIHFFEKSVDTLFLLLKNLCTLNRK
ncbi:hypothetical protein Pas1_07355 [Polynucleobacter paneuropaeus]|uniref:Uncharacterized protein n=1 Tax=Polynucleobacter paneuropaeus TaxID=2527775 RepID=A0A2Z4JUA3_9BURK|nr:hypothetical protein Pas1_07355 [Polynucleobacter paneuropaeus]